jgi:predicted polyphosphate/ATP-dependent NAD kinase
MSKIGIIANPASGKDVRRLVAYASIMGNNEKTELVRRIILGIDSTGVDEILIMPDYCELGLRALSGLSHANIRAKVSILDMTVHGTQEDSTTAMRLMKELGVDCAVTLGGDGTNRAVAKGDRSIPLVTISTGTNNVFPAMVEATTAGIAAGVVVSGKVDLKDVVATHKRLIITENGSEKDMALIDAVVMEQPFIGARAIWKLSEVKQVICTRAEPNSVGLSSIGGSVCPVGVDDDYGLYLKLGGGNIKARAAVLPGVIQEVGIEEFKLINLGEEVELLTRPCLVALDGERELRVGATDEVKVRIERDGPHVVDINKATREAAAQGFFTSRN